MERWLKEEYPKIRSQAKREKAESFFEDDSRVCSDCVPSVNFLQLTAIRLTPKQRRGESEHGHPWCLD